MPGKPRGSPKIGPTPPHGPESPNGPQSPVKGTTLKLDLSNITTDFQPRGKGDYPGTLIEGTLNLASASSGQPTMTLKWSEDESPNRFMFRTYSLQPQALWVLKRDLLRIGASVEELSSTSADIEAIVTALYGYKSVLRYGDPRPGKDQEGNPKVFDNMLEVLDPKKA